MKRVYLSGPITGMPDNNREAFAKAADTLRKTLNVETVINPHDIVLDGDPTAANTTLKCLMDRFRDDGHEDAAAALEEVDFLMREYGFTRDDLTESAMELSAGLRRLVAEWVAGDG